MVWWPHCNMVKRCPEYIIHIVKEIRIRSCWICQDNIIEITVLRGYSLWVPVPGRVPWWYQLNWVSSHPHPYLGFAVDHVLITLIAFEGRMVSEDKPSTCTRNLARSVVLASQPFVALTGLIFVGVSINITKVLSFPKLPDRALLSLVLLLNILVVYYRWRWTLSDFFVGLFVCNRYGSGNLQKHGSGV